MFVRGKPVQPSPMLARKVRAYPSEALLSLLLFVAKLLKEPRQAQPAQLSVKCLQQHFDIRHLTINFFIFLS
jgi:hypothetical protein